MEPGDEFFLHFDYWPDPMPSVVKLKSNVKSRDISIRKAETSINSDCMPIKEVTYIGTHLK